jgi:hypothetical protein
VDNKPFFWRKYPGAVELSIYLKIWIHYNTVRTIMAKEARSGYLKSVIRGSIDES